MKDILNKISQYNLFNYFFPGVLFAVIVSKITPYNLIQTEVLIAPFVYYFLGMAISRFGRIIIDWISRKTKDEKFSEYGNFIRAESRDKKLAVLLEAANTYRTLFAMFFLILLLKGYSILDKFIGISQEGENYILVLLLAILFAVSFKKQSEFIQERVAAVNSMPVTDIPTPDEEAEGEDEKDEEEK